MLHRYRARKAESLNVDTRRLRALTDHLWLQPFQEAWRDITWAAQNGHAYTFIRLPFPFDRDMKLESERVANYWESLGYALRPGGPAGWSQDIIRLERVAS